MNTKKKTILGIGGIVLVIIIAASVGYGVMEYNQSTQPQEEPKVEVEVQEPMPIWKTEGYDSEKAWNEALANSKAQQIQGCDILLSDYRDVFFDEEVAKIEELKDNIQESASFEELHPHSLVVSSCRETAENRHAEKEAQEEAETEAAAEEEAALQTVAYSYEPVYSYNYSYVPSESYSVSTVSYTDGDGLTKSSGVNYYDGRRETYYSSNALYHYRTGEWTVDDEGFYRTSEGNYVVAASDMSQGTTFEGSKGTCEVLDSGCAAGTTDYYTAW